VVWCDVMVQLVTSRSLDRESVSEYSVTLVCRDLGRPSLSTSTQLSVLVTDINDHSPTFLHTDQQTDHQSHSSSLSSPLYVAEIFENNFIGAFVTQVNSTATQLCQCHSLYTTCCAAGLLGL